MQVLCKSTNGNAEVRCCICGQGFVVFWERQSRSERMAVLHEMQQALRRHHTAAPGQDAHPKESFSVPEWDAGEAFSDAVLAGAAANWEVKGRLGNPEHRRDAQVDTSRARQARRRSGTAEGESLIH